MEKKCFRVAKEADSDSSALNLQVFSIKVLFVAFPRKCVRALKQVPEQICQFSERC